MEHTMILTGLAVGIAFGFVLQRGRFCVTNAFRSVWVARSGTWITAFLLVIAVQAIGVTALTQLDLIPVMGFAAVARGDRRRSALRSFDRARRWLRDRNMVPQW